MTVFSLYNTAADSAPPGVGMIALGAGVTVASVGAASAVSIPAVMTGSAVAVHGIPVMKNSAANLANQTGKAKTDPGPENTPAPAAGDKAPANDKKGSEPFMVTPQGGTLPKGTVIRENYVQNPDRPGSYGERLPNGKFNEKLRIDPGTPSGKKGPNDSHFHLDKKEEHIMDPNRWSWWLPTRNSK